MLVHLKGIVHILTIGWDVDVPCGFHGVFEGLGLDFHRCTHHPEHCYVVGFHNILSVDDDDRVADFKHVTKISILHDFSQSMHGDDFINVGVKDANIKLLYFRRHCEDEFGQFLVSHIAKNDPRI